jgi:putative oxidoreductase
MIHVITRRLAMNTTTHPEYAAFLLRLALGVMLLAHGLLKLLVFTLPGTAQFFESVGFPGWLAYVAVILEIGGGLLMLAGYQTRLLALGLVPLMLGALGAHAGNGWVFSAPNGGWEYPAFLTVALIVQSLLGPGAFAPAHTRQGRLAPA